jgi:excisionase family DNA binding protein
MTKAGDQNNQQDTFLTPPEVARLLRVSADKVLGWIRRGELKAVNVSNRDQPRYRVRREHLEEFLAAREVQPPAPRTPRKQRRPAGRLGNDVIEFF